MEFSNPSDGFPPIRVIILAATPDHVLPLFCEAIRFGAVADYQVVSVPEELAAAVRARSYDLAIGLWQTHHLATGAVIAVLRESGQALRSLTLMNYAGAVLVAVTMTEHSTIAMDCERLVTRLDQTLRVLSNSLSLPEQGLPDAKPNRTPEAPAIFHEITPVHDLSELLTVIIGSGEVLLKRFAHNLSAIDYVEQMLGAAKRAGILVDGLARNRQPLSGPIDVGSTLAAARGLLRKVAGAGLSLSIRLDSEPMTVGVDRRWLESVISGVVAHARFSLPEGSLLELSLERVHFELAEAPFPSLSAGQYISIRFNYSPKGLGSKDLARTGRGAPATRRSAAELGLSSVFTLVSEVHGTIALESASWGVSALTIFLPLLYLQR